MVKKKATGPSSVMQPDWNRKKGLSLHELGGAEKEKPDPSTSKEAPKK